MQLGCRTAVRAAAGGLYVDHWEREGIILRSEFALVRVRRDTSANGERLHIEDLGSGRSIYLDPLELEALTRADHDLFRPLLPIGAIIPPDDIGLQR